MWLVEGMLHGAVPAANGLVVEKPPHDLPICPQPPALQRGGSAAPLAAAAPAQQHQGAVEGEDQAVPDSLEVAGTWGDDEDTGDGDGSGGAQCSFSSLQKTGKALLALNRLTLLSQSSERKALEAQDEEGDAP